MSLGGEERRGSWAIELPYPTPLPLTWYGDSDSRLGDCEYPSGRPDGFPWGVEGPYGETPLPGRAGFARECGGGSEGVPLVE